MQDLAESAIAKELNVEKVECDMHKGNEVGASSVGQLTRSKDKAKLHTHSLCLCYVMLSLKPC